MPSLLNGRMLERPGAVPAAGLCLRAVLCDWGRAFIAKGMVGRHYRAISRNGRVLLASDRPLVELKDRLLRLRITHWHRQILPGKSPSPWGLVLSAWTLVEQAEDASPRPTVYRAHVSRVPLPQADLSIDLGGLRVLSLTSATDEAAGRH